jgi:hypothetical protein
LVSFDVTNKNEQLISGSELCDEMGYIECQNSVNQYKDI